MRLFFAIHLPKATQEALIPLIEPLKSNVSRTIRWLPPHTWHITLQFIKEMDQALLPKLVENQDSLGTLPRFKISFTHIELFPNKKKPIVIAIQVEASKSLSMLATFIQESMMHLQIPLDQRTFRPHLSLARVTNPFVRFDPVHLEGMEFTASEIILNESVRTSRGYIYSPVHRFQLRQST